MSSIDLNPNGEAAEEELDEGSIEIVEFLEPLPPGPPEAGSRIPRQIAVLQSAFFVATGLWPIVHYRSFEAASGRKREPWLVKTMGLLIASVGAALGVAASEPRSSRAVVTLGLTSAAALAASDVWFTATGRLRPVYLVNAAVECAIAAAWGVAAVSAARTRAYPHS